MPRQRFKIYARLVELLIEKHPQMRQRASHADGGPLTATEVTTLFAAVAYRLRVKDPAGAVTKPEMRKLIVESMTDDEVLGYEQPAARRIADAVLAMAEEEFGLIVSHGAGSFGFLASGRARPPGWPVPRHAARSGAGRGRAAVRP